jgi:hypothetical protein
MKERRHYMSGFLRDSRWMLVAIGITVAPLLFAADGEHSYTGSKKCKICHMKEYKSWAETKMAQSFDVLKPGVRTEEKKGAGLDPNKDYTTDPECLICHTTGYGKTGGFVDAATTPDHVGVGCEMCHGAGGTYVQKPYMTLQNKEYKKEELVAVGMVAAIGAENCTSVCHNTKSPFVGDDFVFDFESQRHKGTHEKFPLKYEH